MTDRDASQTALATAALRAAHQIFDAAPLILDDPAILRLLGAEGERRIAESRERYCARPAQALRAHVVLRSRFAEDRLAAAVARGVGQYVILGAGLDTFAYRQPAWAKRLRIVEVDHGGTQDAKRARLAKARITLPANLQFASIDFERESLRDGLLRQGVTLEQPTFFSWLGVTMYLAEAAVDAVLRSVAQFPSGSEIVLTFSPPPDSDSDAAERGAGERLAARVAARVAEAGEPFVSHFTSEQIEAKLRAVGFGEVEFLMPEASAMRYFADRADLPAPCRTTIVSAVI